MIARQSAPGRLATGAKMLVALLAAAALPAWVLGQGNPQPKPEVKILELKDLKVSPAEFEKGFIELLQVRDAQPKPTAEAKNPIDAKIAELTRQLEELKAARAAAEKAKKPDAPKPEGERKIRTIIIGPDGKIVEGKGGELQLEGTLELQFEGKKAEPKKAEPKAAPQGGLQFKFQGQPGTIIVGDAKTEPKKAEPKGKPVQLEGVFELQLEGVKVEPKKPELRAAPQGGLQFKIEGQPGVIIIGNDGKNNPKPALTAEKQLEDARNQLEKQLQELLKKQQQPKPMIMTLPVAPAAPSAGKVINLTRATYGLSNEKAVALIGFLKANTRPAVLESKFDAAGLTVTTTPEVQNTIGALIKLMQSQGGEMKLRLTLSPDQPK